ncbi:MAG: hypothetical protein A2176_10195 [Spirochaetes bacterium RBG_13_51_14]|nr:MAG: hypothetical protein A2176_10195 [Spirochaetes bacterium RBG_13_51_14]
MKQIRIEIIIRASAERVWGIIIDFDNYHVWNTFTPRITLRSDDIMIGAEFDLDCRMTDQQLLKNEHEVILALEPENFHFCMGTSRTRGRPGIRSFRWQICEPIDAGITRFINYEEFKGPLALVVNLLYAKKLRAAFEKYCLTLKAYAEMN